MAQWDLSTTIAPYLDVQLIFPLLDFQLTTKIYQRKVIHKQRLKLLRLTKMFNDYRDLYVKIYPDSNLQDDEEFNEWGKQVVQEVSGYTQALHPLFVIFENKAIDSVIENAKDGRQLLQYLVDTYQLNPEIVENLYPLALAVYRCGAYEQANHYLYYYQLLSPNWEQHSTELFWGKLAIEIQLLNWDAALDSLLRLREHIEGMTFSSALHALQLRTWLIHWSLFVYFNHPKGSDYIIEHLFYSQNYINTIQTTCPHILRYITTVVISNVSSKTKNVLRDLVRIIQQESYAYKDPITEFIECLCINYDFDGAQQKLRECQELISQEFFLIPYEHSYVENARLLIFETFCRVHECISINMLSEKLNMSREEAEHWIVNLIRNAQLDAKIDSKLGHVMMGNMAVSPYQQLIDKTKSLAYRIQAMASSLENKANLFHHSGDLNA